MTTAIMRRFFQWFLVAALLGMAFIFGFSIAFEGDVFEIDDADEIVQHTDVLTNPGQKVVGRAKLTRLGHGVRFEMSSSAKPNTAYVMFWVTFNYPGECAAFPCDNVDFFNPKTGAGTYYGTGDVSDENGLLIMRATLDYGTVHLNRTVAGRERHRGGVPLLFPRTAYIQPLVIEKGLYTFRNFGENAEQLGTRNGGCPVSSDCPKTVQFMRFLPPVKGMPQVNWLAPVVD